MKPAKSQYSINKLSDKDSPELAVTLSPSGHFQFINEICQEIIGYESCELFNQRYTDFLHSDDLELTKAFLQSLSATRGSTTFINRFVHKKGHTVKMRWHGVWVEEDNSIYFTGREVEDYETDIRKPKEDELHKALVEHGSDMLALFDEEINFIYSSGATERILGYSNKQIAGQNALSLIHPDDVPMVQEKIVLVLASEGHTTIPEFRFRNSKGEWRWLETTLSNQLNNPAVRALVTSSRDVTERLASKQLLVETQERFESLFKDNPDAILVGNRNGFIIDANGASSALFQIPKEAIINRHASEFLSSDNSDIYLKYLQEAFNGDTVGFEIATTLDVIGEKVLAITQIPVTVNGQVLSVHSVIKDITKPTSYQRTISEQAKKLTTIFESITDAFFMLDKDWNLTYINKEAEQLLNLNREFHIGEGIRSLFSEEIDGRIYREYRRAAETGEAAHFEFYSKSRAIWLDVKAFPSEEGLSVYFSDITEKVKTRKELEMLSLVASKVRNGVIIADSEDKVEWVNDGFTRLTGYSLEDILGKTPAELLRNPKTNPKGYEAVASKMKAGEPVSFEILNSHKNGDDIWISVQVSPTLDAQGAISKFIAIHTDITEQKLQSQRLATQKDFYESILNAVPIDVVVFDKDLRYSYINPAAVKDNEVRQWLIGKTSTDYATLRNLPKEQVENRLYYLKKAQLEQTLVEFMDNFTNRLGQEISYMRRVCPVINENGQVTSIISSGIDITADKLVRRQLQQREELYRLLSENSKDTIGLHSADGTPTYLSKSFENLLGYKPEEKLGTSPFDFVHPDDCKQTLEIILQKVVAEKKSTLVQYRAKKSTGDFIWLESDVKPLLNEEGLVIKLQSATRDITQRRQTEEALLSSEKKYRELIKYSHAYIVSHTMEGKILAVNPYLLEQLGYSEGNIVGLNLGDMMPHIREVGVSAYLRHMQQVTSSSGVINIVNKQQERRALFYRNYRVQEPGEQPYIIGIAQDITERMLMEEELRKAKLEADESTRVKENFLANMSHEIRTPLNGIIGMAGLLKKTRLDQLQQNYLKTIRSSSDNLLVIINDILDIAKIEAGKLELEQIAFNLTETVTASFKTLQYRAEEKDLEYVLKPFPELNYSLIGDPYRLNQVLLNLLNNAIKFTHGGTVELEIKLAEESSDSVTLEFSVNDTGIGIPESKRESIFKEFSQAYSDTTRKYGGTGLGLNICRNLLEMQNGQIWVESKEGQGSNFKFFITYMKSSEILEVKQEKELNYTSLENVRLLLAEDNEVNIFLAESLLKGWGAKVDVAMNGKRAVELATSNEYDLILMDIQMPEMNGLQATSLIRQLQSRQKANIPIIALTANAIKGDAEKYMAAGMNGYVTKPFDEETLFLNINKLLKENKNNRTSVPEAAQVLTGPSAEADEPLYNLDMLRKLARGKEAFIDKATNLFTDSAPKQIKKLEDSYKRSDWEGVNSVAHQLKPSVELFGISSLVNVIKEIEQDTKNVVKLGKLNYKIELVSEVTLEVVRQLKERR